MLELDKQFNFATLGQNLKTMKKALKWLIAIVLILVIGLYAAFKWMQSETKKYSPEQEIEYREAGFDLRVYYNRPYKKDRVIFGELVPFGEVWRTGANEATTFSTATDVLVGDKKLPAGKYTLWTIPGEKEWEVIFNEKEYSWGVTWGSRAAREAEFDIVNITIPREELKSIVEQFTIAFEARGQDTVLLSLAWDLTKVSVPISH